VNQDRRLKLAVSIAGVFVSLFASWCAWRLVLRMTNNREDAAFYFVLVGLVTGGAFMRWIWEPLLEVLERRRRR
jgi:hypothetical protein